MATAIKEAVTKERARSIIEWVIATREQCKKRAKLLSRISMQAELPNESTLHGTVNQARAYLEMAEHTLFWVSNNLGVAFDIDCFTGLDEVATVQAGPEKEGNNG